MWTRLLCQNTLKEAFAPIKSKGKYSRPAISGRYQAMLRKEFIMANVPWPFEKPEKSNPRNKKPKGHKAEQLKIIRLEKIKKSLTTTDESMLKYRQDRLNNRKLRGLDSIFSQVIPAWMKFDREEYEEAQKEAENKKNAAGSDDDDDPRPKKSKGQKLFAEKKEEDKE